MRTRIAKCLMLAAMLATVTTGCVSSNMPAFAEALSKDNATIHGKLILTTPWGTETMEFDRSMPTTNAPAK